MEKKKKEVTDEKSKRKGCPKGGGSGMLREKSIALNAYSRKKNFIINNLSFYLNKLGSTN